MIQSALRSRHYWLRLTLFTLVMLGVAALVVIFVAIPIHAADVISYPPRRLVCCQTPANFRLHYEDVSFSTADGLTLRGWYIPGRNGATIIFAHGGGANRLGVGQLEQAAALAERGFGVLLFDQRDHGDSDGNQTSFTGADVLAALNYLRQRSDIDAERIGAIGLSLGAINIVHAAKQDDGLAAIVLDGLGQSGSADLPPPQSLVEVLPAAQRSIMFPVLRLRGVVDQAVIDSLSRMSPRSILFIAGTGQDLEREATRRYFAVTSEPKAIWEIPEGSHAYTWAARPHEYSQRIVDFFEQSLLK